MNMSRVQPVIQIEDASQIGEARRTVRAMAEDLGLDQTRTANAALVATEVTTNILKHAKEGKVVAQSIGSPSQGLQILAIDKGPGIQDMAAALGDGWSTSGTLGGGLGSMRRLGDDFDAYSDAAGTVVLCEFWKSSKSPAESNGVATGILSIPYPGETANGDGWVVKDFGDNVIFMLVDGLGHGLMASDAAREAERIILAAQFDAPADLLRECHSALVKTRGAAIGIATLDPRAGVVRYAGAGNIAGSISTIESQQSMASHNGTAGIAMHRTQEFKYTWTSESLLVLHSDGITAHWDLNKYPGIRNKHPALISAVIYRDFSRARDDSTVLVARAKVA